MYKNYEKLTKIPKMATQPNAQIATNNQKIKKQPQNSHKLNLQPNNFFPENDFQKFVKKAKWKIILQFREVFCVIYSLSSSFLSFNLPKYVSAVSQKMKQLKIKSISAQTKPKNIDPDFFVTEEVKCFLEVYGPRVG